MEELIKGFISIIILIVVIICVHLLIFKVKGDGDIVEIGGKKYIKKVEYMGNDVYDTKYFPIDSLEKKSEKDLEVIK